MPADNTHSVKLAKEGGRHAYARNGNTHAPTFYPLWSAWVDDLKVTSGQLTRRAAREVADLFISSGEVNGQ